MNAGRDGACLAQGALAWGAACGGDPSAADAMHRHDVQDNLGAGGAAETNTKHQQTQRISQTLSVRTAGARRLFVFVRLTSTGLDFGFLVRQLIHQQRRHLSV